MDRDTGRCTKRQDVKRGRGQRHTEMYNETRNKTREETETRGDVQRGKKQRREGTEIQ